MIAANYTAHLYCDCADCSQQLCKVTANQEFIGNSWSECAREARADGWRISADRQRCYAPGHTIKREAQHG
ncbi:hypothetical protein [Serratia liquefaciens]|uniref:hypothetical protein n=1 Tax=Serratia liquefaciens TaxID=614 RepID=UPI0021B7E68D|nr:hypothetical protein [Serratia liquefaciens]